jgi:hypothetical protein
MSLLSFFFDSLKLVCTADDNQPKDKRVGARMTAAIIVGSSLVLFVMV